MRLARFNIQSAAGGDKRYFVGMPSPAAAAIPAATVYAYPWGLLRLPRGAAGAGDGARAGGADGQHDPVPQLQDDRLCRAAGRTPSSLLIAAGIVLIATHPQVVLVVMAYTLPGVGVHRHGDHALPASRRPRRDRRPSPPHAVRDRSAGAATHGRDALKLECASTDSTPDALKASHYRQRDRHRRARRRARCGRRSCRRSTPRCASRSSARARCRSPWSRSTARTIRRQRFVVHPDAGVG